MVNSGNHYNYYKQRQRAVLHHRRGGNSSQKKSQQFQCSKLAIVVLVLFVVHNVWSPTTDSDTRLEQQGRRTDAATTEKSGSGSSTAVDRTLEVSRPSVPVTSPATARVDDDDDDDDFASAPPDATTPPEDDDAAVPTITDDITTTTANATDDPQPDDVTIPAQVMDDKDRGMNDWLLLQSNAVVAPTPPTTNNNSTLGGTSDDDDTHTTNHLLTGGELPVNTTTDVGTNDTGHLPNVTAEEQQTTTSIGLSSSNNQNFTSTVVTVTTNSTTANANTLSVLQPFHASSSTSSSSIVTTATNTSESETVDILSNVTVDETTSNTSQTFNTTDKATIASIDGTASSNVSQTINTTDNATITSVETIQTDGYVETAATTNNSTAEVLAGAGADELEPEGNVTDVDGTAAAAANSTNSSDVPATTNSSTEEEKVSKTEETTTGKEAGDDKKSPATLNATQSAGGAKDADGTWSKQQNKKKNAKKTKQGKTKEDATPSVLPNVIIAGAQKGGTTSIARYLNWTHAACFSEPTGISQGEGKESHFFDNWRIYNGSGLPYYENIFHHCHDQPLIVDATPEYMKNAQRIYDTYTEHGSIDSLKLIFTIREPVSREISWYNHRLRDCKTQLYAKAVCTADGSPKPFKEVANKELVAKLEHDDLKNMYSTYARYLELFFRLFKRSQILVLSYDELQSDQKGFLRRIHKFLNLSGRPQSLPHVNSDFGTHEDPPCDVQRALAKRYEPLNEDLYKLLEANPGPKAEERPFRKFHNKCFDEKYDKAEADPFVKAKSKHIIPNVLISGGDESLVSSTTGFLRQFKNGCGPIDSSVNKTTVVTPNFFDNSNVFKRGVQYYEFLFEHCESKESLVIDGAPEMIKYPRRVREIYEAKGLEKEVKFIFSLREPVRREVLAYQMKASKCFEDPSLKNTVCAKGKATAFDDFAEKHVFSKIKKKKLDYQGGLYAQYLKIWFKEWDRKQILILRHEESESDPKAYAGRILKFLGVDGKQKGINKFRSDPPTAHESVTVPSCDTEKRLSKLFSPYNNNLYKLLKKNPGPKMEQSPFPEFTHECTTTVA